AMKRKSIVLAGFIAVFGSRSATAAPADPHAVDILGLHLGMTVADSLKVINQTMPASALDLKQGTLSLDGFTSKPLTFGALIRRNDGSQQIALAYSLRPDQRLIYISRMDFFSEDKRPVIESFKTQIMQKYGTPTDIRRSDIRFHINS